MSADYTKISLLIIFLSVCNFVIAQIGWQWVNPYPTGQKIHSMSFINANTGMAVTTYGGTIIRTTNGGINWDSYVPFKRNYFGCLMIDENTWLAGDYSDYYPVVIIRTTDKGNNWNIVYNSGLNGGITYFSKFNDSILFAINRNNFLKSTNKGADWIMIPTGVNTPSLEYVQFINENTGFVCGGNTISKTTNGGNNWFSIYSSGGAYNFRSAMFKDENTGFVVSGLYGSFRTINSGMNWTHYPNQSGGGGAFCGDFINVRDSYSTDFGLTWTQRDTIGGFITFSDSNTCYSSANDERNIWKSTNKGINWTIISKNFFNESIDFTICDKNLSFVITGNKIYKTTNSGDSFSQVFSSNQYNFNSLDFSDTSKGIVVGSEGKVLLTTNGGSTWLPKTLGSTGKSAVKYINNKIIVLDTSINKIYISNNSGDDWDTVLISNERPRIMDFPNNNSGYILTFEMKLFKTTNGGYNWFFIKNLSGNSISFLNQNYGIISGFQILRRTFDGGISWDSVYYPSQFYSNSIKIVNPQTVYAAGTNGRVFKSTDGGTNWAEQMAYAYLNNEALKIDFNDSLYGFVMKWGGNMLRTKTGGETNVGVNQISTEVPSDYILHQNYPNPFNSSTNIKFEIQKARDIKIAVYDILGREVRTLINEYKTSGAYLVSFDASGLSSGVYFYKMTAGNYFSVKKLVVLK